MNCLITLKSLKESEKKIGYSKQGLKALTRMVNFAPILPFNRQNFEIARPKVQQGMSISGYQPKLQLTIQENHFDIVDAKGEFILKPSPVDFPYLAENEHATMQVMKMLKFPVPENGLFHFQSEVGEPKERAFVIQRYDRVQGLEIHQEQLDGAMNVGEKYGKISYDGEQYVSYERAIQFILEKLTEVNITVRQDLFLRVVYAYLLGNNDLHLRNFSLILLPSNRIELAPVYDFVSVSPYKAYFNSTVLALPLLKKEEGGQSLSVGFETKYGTYIGIDFVEFGMNIGLSEAMTKKILTDLPKSKDKIIALYQSSFMPETHKEAVLTCYQQRLHYLQIFDEPVLKS